MVGPLIVRIYHLGKPSGGLYYAFKTDWSTGIMCKKKVDRERHTDENCAAAFQGAIFETYEDMQLFVKNHNAKTEFEIATLPPDHDPDKKYTPYTMEIYPTVFDNSIRELKDL